MLLNRIRKSFKFREELNRAFGNKLGQESGMTLVEIMIVLVILGGLITMVGTNVVSQLKKGRIKETRLQISEVRKAAEMYYTECASYPPSIQALIEKPESCSTWGPDPYLKKMPKDAWGKDFIYELDGGSPIIVSLGADNREGGSGENADISSEDL